MVLDSFVSAQAAILLLQNQFGPRFFIPKNVSDYN